MPGRNELAAWRAFKQPIERAVGCLDMTARLVERRFDDGLRFIASSREGISVTKALRLRFSMQLEPVQAEGVWRMTTRKYDYTISPSAAPATVVFGWHWHPESRRSPIRYPHVHVPAATAFSTRHIPTGRVALEDVIEFAFADLGAVPAYAGAREVLDEVSAIHKQHRTWS